jgi:hypothetical protein
MNYDDFIAAKSAVDKSSVGFDVDPSEVNPLLKPHQRDVVCWAIRGGARALFEAFGLGKTVQQIEIIRIITGKIGNGARGLIIAPLGVRQEFMRDAAMLNTSLRFIRFTEELKQQELLEAGSGLWITNYESVRDGRLDPNLFDVVSLDEAACLRGFGGTKTFREFMALFAGDRKALNTRVRSAGVQYRFVATATPSPNDYIELLAYSAFLGIMDVGGAKTRFFKRDSTKADNLTIHPHKEKEFWMWVSSWAIFLQKPSDIGHSDEGYTMPEMEVHWHEVQSDFTHIKADKNGQGRLFRNVAIGVQDASREKRESLPLRIEKMMEIRALDPDGHRLIWHDLEDERRAIEAAIPDVVTVYGSQDLDTREESIIAFSEGKIRELAGKPQMLGSGCNFQYHCHQAIFLGIGFKFADFIQAVHRIQRFMQTKTVRIDLIYTEAEREVRKTLERKWAQHKELVKQMTTIIQEYGLSVDAIKSAMKRATGVERAEVSGEHYRIINNDCVKETASMADNSVGLILTSIPFSTQYEYSPNYADFGHTDNNDHFMRQMDYLTPELLRVLQPGRIAAIHVKDRIVPGGMTGLGFQVVYPFHAQCIAHYQRHGFAYMGMKTIVTDVVRENNQTYRLGWTEQCKDGTKMGVGMPEYLLLFRKPPTDTANAYADLPVVKHKNRYTRSRWQIDAHGFTRSSGNRGILATDFDGLTHDKIFRFFRDHNLHNVYDFEDHVALGEALEKKGALPVTFMLLQPQSWHEDVWTDITRMRTLNSLQKNRGEEMHLCPMQFDLADRVIEQMSNPGEVVYDPFAGIGTVPYRAVLQKRFGLGTELSQRYFADALFYCDAAEKKLATPSLFDLLEEAA